MRPPQSPLTPIYLGLGSNLGDRAEHLASARSSLAASGFKIAAQSSIIETEPYGVLDQPGYLNQVLEGAWEGSPLDLLATCQEIEAQAGRRRLLRWGPRTLDVDILLVGTLVLGGGDLEVPHPGLPQRLFVLRSMVELRPDLIHPTLQRTMRQLYDDAIRSSGQPGLAEVKR